MSASPQANVPSLAARSRELGLGSLQQHQQQSKKGNPNSMPSREKVSAAIALVRAKQQAAASQGGGPPPVSSTSTTPSTIHGVKKDLRQLKKTKETDQQPSSTTTSSSLSSRDTLARRGFKPKPVISTGNHSLGSELHYQARSPLVPKEQSWKETTKVAVGKESSSSSSSSLAKESPGSFMQNIFTSRSQAKGSSSSTTALPNLPSLPNADDDDGGESFDKDQENAHGYGSAVSQSTATSRSSVVNIFDKVEQIRTLRSVQSAPLKAPDPTTTTATTPLKQPHLNSVRSETATSVRSQKSGSTIPAPPSFSFDSDSDPGVDPNTLLNVSQFLDKIGSNKSKSKSVSEASKQQSKMGRIGGGGGEEVRATKETDWEQTDTDSTTSCNNNDGVNPETLAEIGAFIDAMSGSKMQNEAANNAAAAGMKKEVEPYSDDESSIVEDEVPPETQNDVLFFLENLEKKKKKIETTPSVDPSIPSVPSMTDTEQQSEAEQVPQKAAAKAAAFILYTSSSDSCGIPKPSVDSIYQKLQPVPQGANIDPPASDPYYSSDKADPPTPNDVVEELMRMREASDDMAPSYSAESLDSEFTYNTGATVSFTQEEKQDDDEDDDDDDGNSEAALANDAYDSFAKEVKDTLESRNNLSSIAELEGKDSAESDDAATFGVSVNTVNALSPVAECGTSKEEESEDEKRGLAFSPEEDIIDLTKYELEDDTVFMAEDEEVMLLGSVPPPPKPESVAAQKTSTTPQNVEASEPMDYEAMLLEALDTQLSEESAYHADREGEDTANLALRILRTEKEKKSVAQNRIFPKDSLDLVGLDKEGSNHVVENADSYASSDSEQIKALNTKTDDSDATFDSDADEAHHHPFLQGMLSQDSSEILPTDSEGTSALGKSGSLATRSESEDNDDATAVAQRVTQVLVVDEGDEGVELMDMIPTDMPGRGGYESESSALSVIHPPAHATHRKVNPKNDLDSARAAAALLTGKKDTTQRDGCFMQCGPSAGKEEVVLDNVDEESTEMDEEPTEMDEEPAEMDEEPAEMDEEPAETYEEAQISGQRRPVEDALTFDDWSELPSKVGTTAASTKSTGPDDYIERMRSDDDTIEKKDSDKPKGSLKVDAAFRDKPSLLDGTDDASESKNARRTVDEDDDYVAAFLSGSETVETAEENEVERAETNECFVSQGVDAFEVALDKTRSDIGKNKSEYSSGLQFQSKEEPSVGGTQSDAVEDSEIFLEQFAALGVDEESIENAKASSKKDKKKQPPTPIETKSDLKATDPPTGRSPVKQTRNKLRYDLRTPRQIAKFFATMEPSDEAPVDEKKRFKRFKKLIAPVIEGEKPSIVDAAKIRQAAERAEVPIDAVDQILEHAEGRQPIALPSKTSDESNAGSNLGDAEEVDEEEAISAFLWTGGDRKPDHMTQASAEFANESRSQDEVIQLVEDDSFDDKIEHIAEDDEDDEEAEDGEEEWWKVSGKDKKRDKNASHGSTWDDASSTDVSASNGQDMEAEDEDEVVVDLTDTEDEVPTHAEDELPPRSKRVGAKTLRRKGHNGIRVESRLKNPSLLSIETPINSFTYDNSDDIHAWLRKSAMANYGTSWEKHKRWLSPRNAAQLGKPKPIDGVAAAENLNKIARRRKFLPANPWNRTYKGRTKYHPGYFNVDVYSIYDTSAVDHGEPDELDLTPWEHRDVKQRFLHEKSILFSRNWFGDLVRVRGNDKYRPPVCQPKSMEMPIENIPDPGEWTEEWYTTWKAPDNRRRRPISASHSGSEGSSVDEGSRTEGRSVSDRGSFSDNDSADDQASSVGGDDDDDSWEEAPECGIIVNVKQKIGERVSRVHPDYTSSLRRSRWRRKYFPRGTFPY